MLKTAACNLRTQLTRERQARAQGAESRGYAHFVADAHCDDFSGVFENQNALQI